MIGKPFIASLADQIAQLPKGADLKNNVQQLLSRQLNKLNLVSRDEFEAQQSVLLRTREKLESLEKQLHVLEQKLTEK